MLPVMTFAALARHLLFLAALALLSAAIVRLMISARVLDRPDARKVHSRPTPKGGGVGIVVAYLGAWPCSISSPSSPASPTRISAACSPPP